MPNIVHKGRVLPVIGGESVLDCLLRNGVEVAHGCRAGACQACEQRATKGSPTPVSQIGLDPSQQAKGHFLACQCRPTEDLVIEAVGNGDMAFVRAIERLSDRVIRLRLARPDGFDYRAGQFIRLSHAGVTRSYSLASVPEEDDDLELHVRRVPGGRMTGYLFDQLRVGDRLQIDGPAGGCVYQPGAPTQPLLLCGTGTGLAPLLGVARDALHRGHRGPIQLFHGVRTRTDAYAVDVLRALQARYPSFSFTISILDGTDDREVVTGALPAVIERGVRGVSGRKIFLCGDPDMVSVLRRWAVLAGAHSNEILMDPFIPAEAA